VERRVKGAAGQRLLRARKERRTCGRRLTQSIHGQHRRSSMILGPLAQGLHPILLWWPIAHHFRMPSIEAEVVGGAGGPTSMAWADMGQVRLPVGVAMPGIPSIAWVAAVVSRQNV